MSYPLALLPITVAILAAVRTLLRLAACTLFKYFLRNEEFFGAFSLLIGNRVRRVYDYFKINIKDVFGSIKTASSYTGKSFFGLFL
jgi:hypothetical protein